MRGTRWAEPHRATPGVKWFPMVEADGGPLAMVVAAANIPDARCFNATVEAVFLVRPSVGEGWPQHLWLDWLDRGYMSYIALIGDRRPTNPTPHKLRQWVVERTLGWVTICQAVPVRCDT